MGRICTKKAKTAIFIVFISACAGFAIVLIVVASSQLSSGMPMLGTAALTMAIMTTICCYAPEELEGYSSDGSSGSLGALGMDDDDALRQSAKDTGAVLSGILLSVGFGINLLLWRFSVQYTTTVLLLTVIGNTLLLSAIISVVWLFCFAPRVWSGGDTVGTVGW